MGLDSFNKNSIKELDVGECIEMDMKMDREKFKTTICRVSEDKWKMKSDMGNMEMDMKRKDIENVKGF